MKKLLIIFLLAACNAVSIKPHSMDKSRIIFADRGGYTMKYAAKDELEKRGYKINVGEYKGGAEGDDVEIDFSSIPKNARYALKVKEKDASFSPLICMFGGFYWWRFNVSIADNETGEELLAWTGRGCRNWALRRLRRLVAELEQQ